MQHARAWLRQYGTRRTTRGPSRCLALALAFVFAIAAVLHVPDGNHTALAAPHSHELASMAQKSGDEPCCPGGAGEFHGAGCAATGGCSFCVPAEPAAASLPPYAAPVSAAPGTLPPDTLPAAHFRPPKPVPNA